MEEAIRNKATDNLLKLEQGQWSGEVWLLALSSTTKANLFVPLDSQHPKFRVRQKDFQKRPYIHQKMQVEEKS